MTLKKFSAFLCAVFTAFVLIGTVETETVSPSVAYAAKGGSFRPSTPRPSAPKAAPKPSAPKSSTQQKSSTQTPSASQKKPAAAATRQQSGGIGGMLRGIGLFAGGMMLGSLLGNMFGFGGFGAFSTIMGILFNILLYGAIISIAIWGFRRLFGKTAEENPYSSNRNAFSNTNTYQSQQAVDWDDDEIPDIRPPKRETGGKDYDPKTTADWYRRH